MCAVHANVEVIGDLQTYQSHEDILIIWTTWHMSAACRKT